MVQHGFDVVDVGIGKVLVGEKGGEMTVYLDLTRLRGWWVRWFRHDSGIDLSSEKGRLQLTMLFTRDRVDVGVCVWLFKEMLVEEPPFRVGELDVYITGNEEVDAIAEVAEEADFVDEARCRRQQRQTRYSLRDQERQFLRDHPAHADAYHVQ